MNYLANAFRRIARLKSDGQEKIAIEDYVQDVIDGHENAYKLAVELKATETFIAQARKQLQEHVINDIEAGNNEYLGFKLHTMTTATKFDFSLNEDWLEIQKQEKELADKRKAIESKMKLAYKNGVTFSPIVTGKLES